MSSHLYVATFGGKTTVLATGQTYLFADQTFKINPEEKYVFRSAVQGGNEEGAGLNAAVRQYIGWRRFLPDGRDIWSQDVFRSPGAIDTRLTQPLAPGDTVVHLEDATGWYNDSIYYRRWLAFFTEPELEYKLASGVFTNGSLGAWAEPIIPESMYTC